MWSLDLEGIIDFIEYPHARKKNYWRRLTLDISGSRLTCRYSHTVGLIDQRRMLVFGGINDEGAIRSVFSYDYIENSVQMLKEKGDLKTRIGHDMLTIGGGMFLLYGGIDPARAGPLTDLWHLKVHLEDNPPSIHYTEEKYKNAHDHYILSWRKGFSLHYLRSE